MKLVKEHISFTQDSDPIHDMEIGRIDIQQVFKDTVVDGINRWYKFMLKDLSLVGKKVTFYEKFGNKKTTIITKVMRGSLPNEIYVYDSEQVLWTLDITKPLFIHE